MFNKIYASVKKFIKENYKAIIFLICFYLFMNVKLPYYIWVAGGTIDLDKDDRITMENAYNYKGSFNLAYVTEVTATAPTYLLSYVIPMWNRVPVGNYQYDSDETLEELYNRGKIDLDSSKQTAIYVAYTNAGKAFNIKDTKYYIYYVDPHANENIMVGDEVVEINGIKINDKVAAGEVVKDKKAGDIVKIKVIRDSKEYEYDTTLFEEEGKAYIGIVTYAIYDYEVDPKIALSFKGGEAGSSGGLTLTLAIYNKLVEEDITKGLKIVGTGTIDMDGKVGEIGGVKYKLQGAVKAKADVFLVPNGSNYEECIKLKKKNNYDIKIIGIDTFTEALSKLKEL